jgi:hypothetical protein
VVQLLDCAGAAVIFAAILIGDVFALYGLARVFAGGAQSIPRGKILCVALLAPMLTGVIATAVGGLVRSIWADMVVALVVVGCVLTVALIRWCRINRTAAIKITGSYLGVQIVLTTLLAGLFAAA